MLHPRALLSLLLALGCARDPAAAVDAGAAREERIACNDRDPERRALFGDLHVHTALSFDAWTYDVRTTPESAYRFARGERIFLPPLDGSGKPTVPVQLARPLDFAAVTDHAEYLGETSLCISPGSPAWESEICRAYRGPRRDYLGFGLGVPGAPRAPFCGDDGRLCTSEASSVWRSIQDAAEAAYDRSAACRFTTFVAYEYSLAPFGSNLHRNVIFRNRTVPKSPISQYEAPEPLDLWRRLDAECRRGGSGCDVLAIPHNSNLSNGRMFVVEYPEAMTLEEQRAQARLRADLEPLVEISQHKGDSECANGLPGALGAPDEQCDYEKLQSAPFRDCGPSGKGYGGFLLNGCVSRLDFVRGALGAGLAEEQRLGVNPYRLGIIASTDTHNGIPGAVDERGFPGHLGIADGTAKEQLNGQTLAARPLISHPGGLAGVWAEENSRDALFDALRRREVFGTSGPRISVRLFGGWGYPRDLCARPDLVARGYEGGVAMGGVLPKRAPGDGAPGFVVAALRDPGTVAQPGTKLQRLQIVKGWLAADGAPREKVYDIAGDARRGARVDLATCAPSGPGDDTLCARFDDPEFDPAARAFYYARVIENPSCRWSTWVCNTLSAGERKALRCDDLGVPKTIQERAWSSPIWYSP